MSSVWLGASDRISQSSGPGTQVPVPLTTVPGMDGEEHALATLRDPQLDQPRLAMAGQFGAPERAEGGEASVGERDRKHHS